MKYKRYCQLIALLLLGSWITSSAQKTIAEEIDQQVWEVFKKSYGNKNAADFNAIHTDDVLRITPSGIRVGQAYRDQNIKSFSRKDGPSRTIDFRFERRIHENDIAYEIGYYQITQDNGDRYYGRFSVLLKKENDRWRIAQDWDTNDINGHKVGIADWDKLAIE